MKTARTQEIQTYFERIAWLEEIAEVAKRLVYDFSDIHLVELRHHIDSLERFDESNQRGFLATQTRKEEP